MRELSAVPPSTLVHLACGRQIIPGWVNLDRNGDLGAEVVFDLDRCARERLPFEDDSVDGFLMHRAFAGIADAPAMMRELHRAARPGARFVFRVPFPATAATFDWFPPRWRVKRIKWVVEPELLAAEGEGALRERIAREPAIVRETVIEAHASKPPRADDRGGPETAPPAISGSRVDVDSAFDRAGT